ncbi:MAG: DUF6455 family protein [Betaproteobacteria bacterium]|nr:DUF6455 family protein [Betaproteobacteria bacterium]
MSTFMTVLLAAVLVTAVAVVAYALAIAWQHALGDGAPLPLYGMLKQHGLSVGEASDEFGTQTLAYAMRRCVYCTYGGQCQQRIAAGQSVPIHCPNAGLFARLTQPRA